MATLTKAAQFIPSVRAGLRVAVCVATFRRPEQLRHLLAGLCHQTFRRTPTPEIIIVVVDNDASRSAEEICNVASLPWPLKYATESRRGISQARNRAIREAGDVDFIAFIDDDECPSPAWLDELLFTQHEFAADVVSGPVIPDFDRDVPEWVRAGIFFNRAIHHSGQSLHKCHTGNVLIRKTLFDSIDTFDERFALTGGEDTQFFLRVRHSGSTIIGSSRAVVHETVSRSRGNLRWILRRAYQSGNSWVFCELSLNRTISTRIIRLFKACGWISLGALSIPVSLFRGRASLAGSLRNIVLGIGMLAGLAGHNFKPYQSAGAELVRARRNQ